VPAGELHPFVLHFAVALLLAAPLCDAFGLLLRREGLLSAGRWNTLLGTAAAALSVLTGLYAQAALGPHSAAGEPLLHLHEALGYLMLAVWVPVAAWRLLSRQALPLRARTLYLTGAFVGGSLALVQALLGSALVYRHGVGVSAAARSVPVPHAAPSRIGVEKSPR
jgi:uncharacterized membrane protein